MSVKKFEPDDRKLLVGRRNRLVFVLRIVGLVMMSGALTVYGLSQIAERSQAPIPRVSSPLAGSTPLVFLPASSPPPDSTASSLPEPGQLSSEPKATGVLAKDALAISDDGVALIRLPKGTKVLDARGEPVSAITVTATELSLRTDIGLVSRMAYTFSPEETTLDPPAALVFSFDPNAWYPFRMQDIDCAHMNMAYYLGEKSSPVWRVPWLNISVDQGAGAATAQINELGTFILFCQVFTMPVS